MAFLGRKCVSSNLCYWVREGGREGMKRRERGGEMGGGVREERSWGDEILKSVGRVGYCMENCCHKL